MKQMDEFGECYIEQNGLGFRERNTLIRVWLHDVGENYIRAENDDIVQLIKHTGEELWFYEEHGERQSGDS